MVYEAGAWDRKRNGMSLERFGEHTVKGVKAQFEQLDAPALERLQALPTVLAYERQRGLPAHVARITRIAHASRAELRFDHEPLVGVAPITSDRLVELAWDLDISDVELNRTHWAVKDVDLARVLQEAGHSGAALLSSAFSDFREGAFATLVVRPSVFKVPTIAREPQLVAVMMPFEKEFDETYSAIKTTCKSEGLACERADDVWNDSTIMQDVFELIYRSAITIVDLSGRNSKVLYETGIAHTLGREVIPISRDVSELPFDLAQHRTLGYLPNNEGLSEMQEKLARRLRTLKSRKGR